MDFEFTLNENDKKIVVAYGVLALYSLQNSANKDKKIEDIKLEDFAEEIKVTCQVRSITDVLEQERKLIEHNVMEKC